MRFGRTLASLAVFVLHLGLVGCKDDPPNDGDGGVACTPACGAFADCNADGQCVCRAGATGDPVAGCVPDCSATGCVNGICDLGANGPTCSCGSGWQGTSCDEPANACLTATRCMNGGVCVPTGPGSFSCDCPAGFTGQTCQMTAVGCATRPCEQGSCTPGSGGSVSCVCERGYTGAACDAEEDACAMPDPCAVAGTCADVGAGNADFTCTPCDAGASGARCEVANAGACGAYVDVVYRIAGTFRVANTPLGAGDVTKDIAGNASEPDFAHEGITSAFPPTQFSNGHIRLRFHNGAAGTVESPAPSAGSVEVIEWYLPIEFEVTGASIPTVRTDVDHSAGMVALVNRYADYQQVLDRACRPVASGVLTGTTLDWDTCSVTPPPVAMATSFRSDVAQANVDTDDGCLRRTTSSGNARCVSGSCGLVPSVSVGDLRNTWDQPLNNFVFSGEDYTTATFTMAEIQIPNDTGTSTWLTITSAVPGHIECGDAPSCDESCDADSCQTTPPSP